MLRELTKPAGDGLPRSDSAGESISAGAAEGGAFRLDKRTYVEQSRYAAYIRNYENGLAEASWSFVGAAHGKKKPRGQSEKRKENEQRAHSRARTNVRQKVLALNAGHMLTLTFRENVTDFGKADRAFTRFVKRVHRCYPNWKYVAVAEQQARGAWHFHLAVQGWQDVGFLREAWLRCVGDGQGNIDVQAPKGAERDKRLRIVRYLCKYLGKAFGDARPLNRHRFRASLDIEVPCASIVIPPHERNNVAAYVISQLHAVAGRVGHIWISPDLMAGYACSWR